MEAYPLSPVAHKGRQERFFAPLRMTSAYGGVTDADLILLQREISFGQIYPAWIRGFDQGDFL